MFQKFVTKHCSHVLIISKIAEDIFLIRHEIGKHLLSVNPCLFAVSYHMMTKLY
jgi:hypothetical protein